MKDAARAGRIVTLDSSPYRLRLAGELHRNLGLDDISLSPGLFADTLRPALSDLGSVDLTFLDGHHRYQPTLDSLDAILERAAPDAVLVLDDIRWSGGMRRAWSRIRKDDRFDLVVDLVTVGACVCRAARRGRPRYAAGPGEDQPPP